MVGERVMCFEMRHAVLYRCGACLLLELEMACESDVGQLQVERLGFRAASQASQQLVTSVRPRIHHSITFA